MTLAHTFYRKARSFWRLPRFVRFWLLPCVLLLLLARLAILLFSFRRLAPLLGEATGPHPFLPIIVRGQVKRVRQIGKVIQLASRRLRLRDECFPRALVASLLLAFYRIPYCVYFGVARGEGGIDAHAWVFAGPLCVSGGHASFGRYRVVGVFAARGLLGRG